MFQWPAYLWNSPLDPLMGQYSPCIGGRQNWWPHLLLITTNYNILSNIHVMHTTNRSRFFRENTKSILPNLHRVYVFIQKWTKNESSFLPNHPSSYYSCVGTKELVCLNHGFRDSHYNNVKRKWAENLFFAGFCENNEFNLCETSRNRELFLLPLPESDPISPLWLHRSCLDA